MEKFLLIFILVGIVVAEKVTYENHSLFKIIPNNAKQLEILRKLYESADEFEFWRPPSQIDEFVSVVSPPELRQHLEDILEKNGISGKVMLENLQEAFDEQIELRSKRNVRDRLTWTNFQILDDIYDWFYELESQFPNTVRVITVGETYEGRNITGIRITRNSGRRAFVLEGGIQGADWLTPATLTFIANELIFGPETETRRLTQDFDWYIFPVINPDGYEYTQNRIRTWVRNRRPTQGGHTGVDLTRNWNCNWGASGGSFDPAQDNYVGPGPFSEPETLAFSRFLDSISGDIFGYFAFRGFGQRFILPFANSTEHLSNYNEMVTIGRRAMGSLAVRHGTIYRVGTSAEVHDGATGNAGDWVKTRFNTPMVATYHVRDEGNQGFAIHPNQLLPNAREIFDSILALIREARFINFI